MVIPVVYMFSGEEGLKSSGPGLMFISLPKIFEQMPGGQIIGLLFFILVFFAALTSSVSIMEAIVSSIMDKFKRSRKAACAITVVISLVLGIPSSLGFGIWSNIKILGMDFLSFFDYLSNNLLMPVVALLTCILIGWVIGTKTISKEVTLNGEVFRRRIVYDVMMKYVAPILLVIILVFFSLAQFGLIKL
jgi:NSS family neurotransmitter:Na+ symporter